MQKAQERTRSVQTTTERELPPKTLFSRIVTTVPGAAPPKVQFRVVEDVLCVCVPTSTRLSLEEGIRITESLASCATAFYL
jgi:hypothetical protein